AALTTWAWRSATSTPSTPSRPGWPRLGWPRWMSARRPAATPSRTSSGCRARPTASRGRSTRFWATARRSMARRTGRPAAARVRRQLTRRPPLLPAAERGAETAQRAELGRIPGLPITGALYRVTRIELALSAWEGSPRDNFGWEVVPGGRTMAAGSTAAIVSAARDGSGRPGARPTCARGTRHPTLPGQPERGPRLRPDRFHRSPTPKTRNRDTVDRG